MTKLNVLILGASDRADRYSFKAFQMLSERDYPVILVAKRVRSFLGTFIFDSFPTETKVDVITLYVGANNQEDWYDSILQARPKKVIFNPGTENPAFQLILDEAAIPWEEACTLVLLQTNQFP